MAFLLSLEGIQRRDLDTGAKLFAALLGVFNCLCIRLLFERIDA